MKKLNVILATLVASVSLATAEELSVSTTFAWESEYLFRGASLAEDTFMPAVDVSYGAFYAGIWAALPVDATAYSNEVDFYAGYGLGVSETVSLDLGFCYYTYPDAQDDFFDGDTNTLEFYVGASFEVAASPSVYVYYDIDLEQLTLEGSVGHSFEVSEASAIDLSAHLGYADVSGGVDWFYYGVGVSYGYTINDAVSASVGINYQANADYDWYTGGDDDEISFGFSVSAGF